MRRYEFLVALAVLVVSLAVAPSAHAISFIDSPSPHCYHKNRNRCGVSFHSMYVDAGTGSYMVSLYVELDGVVVFNSGAFFQQTIDLDGSDFPKGGFAVACGDPVPPAMEGDPTLGSPHSYTIRAKDSGGLKSANYGTIYCPPRNPVPAQ